MLAPVSVPQDQRNGPDGQKSGSPRRGDSDAVEAEETDASDDANELDETNLDETGDALDEIFDSATEDTDSDDKTGEDLQNWYISLPKKARLFDWLGCDGDGTVEGDRPRQI